MASQTENVLKMNKQMDNFIKTNITHKHIDDDWVLDENLKPKAGTFGVVHFARKKDNEICGKKVDHKGGLCVYKKIKIDEFKEIEPRILELMSDNIHSMKYYGCAKDDEHIYIYTEYNKNVISLNELVVNRGTMSEDQIFKLFEKVVLVLKEIHENNIIHRDIKGDHILFLLNENENKDIIGVKLIDFGVSKLVTEKDGSKYYSYTGTEAYVAPEVKLRNNTASRKSDVYSLGCVLIKMVGGELNEKGGTPELPKSNISNRLKYIIQRCIAVNPDARLDSTSLFKLLNKEVKSSLVFKPYDLNSSPTASISPNDKSIELKLPNKPLLAGTIPESVESVKLVSFNQEVEYDAIPKNVTYLDLGDSFDIKENGQDLPTDSIKTLRCGYPFTVPINSRSLPQSITDLQLHNYNQPINKNSIPSAVSYLTLGNNFTHFESLTNLPQSIISLEFNCATNFTDASAHALKESNPFISSLIINGVDLYQNIN